MIDAPNEKPVAETAEEKFERPAWGWKNRLWIWVNTIFMSLVLLGIVIGVNVIAKKFYRRFDITSAKTYEISDYTVDTLKKLKKAVVIYQMPVRASDQQMGEAAMKIPSMLEEYAMYSPQVQFIPVMESNQDLMIRLKQKVDSININDILVMCGDRFKVVDIRDTYRADPETPRLTLFKGEAVFTSAIKEVTSGEKIKVYFTSGHGELDPQGVDPNTGLSMFTHYMEERGNCSLQTVSLLTESVVPKDCDVLAVVYPRRPFSNQAFLAMQNYLDRGGRMLVVNSLDVLGDPMKLTGLERFLEPYGVQLYHRDKSGQPVPDMIWEKEPLSLGGDAKLMPSVARVINPQGYSSHKVNEGLTKSLTVLPYASVVRQTQTLQDNIFTQFLLKAPDTAWDETNPAQLGEGRYNPGIDPKGDLTMAIAVEIRLKEDKKDGQQAPNVVQKKKPDQARMVVIGSGLFLSNYVAPLSSFIGNFDFGVNSIKWLAEREEEITAIQPKRFSDEPIKLDDTNRDRFERGWWICGLLVPSLGLILGLVAWFMRRK